MHIIKLITKFRKLQSSLSYTTQFGTHIIYKKAHSILSFAIFELL